MRVFISADMEGVTGLVAASELLPEGADYPRFRALMTADVNAAIAGLVAGGAASVLVCDAHNNSRNILIEDLHPAARLIRGGSKPLGMMEGMEATFAAACFVGYHAMFGTHRAIADHTWDPYAVQAVTINGRLVGEIGLNAAIAGWFGVPVALVTGDDATARETADLLPWAERVIIKEAKGRFAADCLRLRRRRRSSVRARRGPSLTSVAWSRGAFRVRRRSRSPSSPQARRNARRGYRART